jgi:hypothetical protein
MANTLAVKTIPDSDIIYVLEIADFGKPQKEIHIFGGVKPFVISTYAEGCFAPEHYGWMANC